MFEKYKTEILKFYRTHKRMPTYREIAALLGFKSTNAVYRLVTKLIDEGVVTKDKQGKLIPNRLFGEVPMLGLVTAGLPAMVEAENFDSMSLDDFMIEKKEATFMLEVDENSMIEAHIADGDLIIAEQSNKAKDGDIVIAEIDGEWTMKYFRQKGEKIWLEPANKNYKPLYPDYDLKIAAVVKGVIRKY